MKTIRIFAILAAFASALFGQAAGTITIAATITAVAGTGTSAVTCVMTTPALPAVHVVCSVGSTQMLLMDATPAVGATNGASGTFSNAGNSVTWILQQATAGTVTWQLAANGVSKSGTFQ